MKSAKKKAWFFKSLPLTCHKSVLLLFCFFNEILFCCALHACNKQANEHIKKIDLNTLMILYEIK